MRSEIGLGDLLRAFVAVNCEPDALAVLVRLLGFAEAQALPSHRTSESPESIRRLEPAPIPPKVRDGQGGATRSGQDSDAGSVTLEPLLAAPTPALPSWLSTITLPAPGPGRESLAPAPLFAPVRERALLSAMARRMRAEGELDVSAIVESVARLSLPQRLPRRRIPSLQGGVQLVLDRTAFMEPFSHDVERISQKFREVVGSSLAELQVHELPPEVFAEGEDMPRTWEPPRSGTAVVVVSDLGRAAHRHGRHGPRVAWRALVLTMQAAGCEPVVLVPGRSDSYLESDRALRDVLLLGWDRSARVAKVTQFRKGSAR